LKGTKAFSDREGMYLTHKLTSGTFAMGAFVKADGKNSQACVGNSHTIRMTAENSHTSRIVLKSAENTTFEVFAAVTSPMKTEPVRSVKTVLVRAEQSGRLKLFAEHKRSWKTFWLKSFMESGDDYLDSLWHITMYYAEASQRGRYPGRFINGLWGWNRDVQNWNFYFHWNQQEIYWPLNAAGHHDLLDSYLNYRFDSLPHAKEDAQTAFKVDGAIVSDVSERRGYNSKNEFHNHTPVAQIAMDFWRQYQYTGNREFLKTKAWPYILEAAKFFESLFEKGKDGKYHAKEGTGYEGWILLHDCISELVYGKVLFTTALEALEESGENEPRAEKWREIRDNLVSLKTIKAENRFIRKRKFERGWFKGDVSFSDKLLAAGFGVKEKKWMTSFLPEIPAGPNSEELFELNNMLEGKPKLPDAYRDDIRCNDGIFPWVEYAAVFPSGLIGVGQKSSELYKIIADTVKMFACPGMGWSVLPIALARLGLATEAKKIINSWPMYWQYYCNGWGHYGPLAIMKSESTLPNRRAYNGVMDASLPDEEQAKKRFPFLLYPFRHMGMESMSVLATAMNESLLQSYDGVIRIGPAVTEDQNARFTLHAQNGFIVSAEIKKGKVLWMVIESKLGKQCQIANPWSKAVMYEDGKKMSIYAESMMAFDTKIGNRYWIVPNENVIREWKTVAETYEKNMDVKVHASGYVSLGLPRLF
jgi:hypothetical protein